MTQKDDPPLPNAPEDTLRQQAFVILSRLRSGTEDVVRLDAALAAVAAERERLSDELRLCCELKRQYQEQAAVACPPQRSKQPEPGSKDRLDDQDFYVLMQDYRHAAHVEPKEVVRSFEAVKTFIRAEMADRAKELEADARRYRWLRNEGNPYAILVFGRLEKSGIKPLYDEELDAAIDRAQGEAR